LRNDIQREGYFERFNEIDKRIRNNMTLDDYISGCRILFPWEQVTRPMVPSRVMIFNRAHEGGFPHTHGRYIMTPSLDKLTPSTYLHEQIHVYQRYHPAETNAILTKKYPIEGSIGNNCRANPDTNTIQYAGLSAEYVHNAKSLTDTKDTKDHPYEVMAYLV